MTEVTLGFKTTLSQRIESIDVIRGITILIMLFVNDIAGVVGVPAWMKHMPTGTDGITFVDIVFPAFLFIVGMSIPFAIGKRLQQGESLVQVWKHILIRTIGLLIIGIFMVNSGSVSNSTSISPQLWILLMYTGVILVWNVLPGFSRSKKYVNLAIKAFGILFLLLSALFFKGNNMTGLIQLLPKWWGILGLIGWAYFIACLFYIPMRNHIPGMIIVIALLYCVYLADEAGYFSEFTFISNCVNIGKFLGTHSAIVVSGIVLGMILTPQSIIKTHNQRLKWAFWYSLGLTAAGVMLHSLCSIHKMFIIDKNLATAPWGLLCSAITIWIFIIIYWLIDKRGWKGWTKVIEPAGTNALFAYILAPIFYTIFTLIVQVFNGFDFYQWLGSSFIIGFFRSIIFAFLMTWLAGFLRRKGLWLKL
jgi:predicted acyltransferase